MRTAVLFVAAVALLSCQLQAQVSFGGVVVDEAGQPVAGAGISWCQWLPGLGLCGSPYPSGSTKTDANGRFLVSGIGGAVYRFCASGSPNQLSTCSWPDVPPAPGPNYVDLTRTANVTDLKLVLRTGRFANIRFSDPGKWYARGVLFPGTTPTSVQGTEILFSYVWPKNYPWTFYAGGSFAVFDDSGKCLPASSTVPALTVPGGTEDFTVHLTLVSVVVNAASYLPGLPYDGLASVFYPVITNVQGIVAATSLPLPTQIAGTSVTIDGVLAPLLAVANVNGQEQINFQIPVLGLYTKRSDCPTIEVNNNGKKQSFYLCSSASLQKPNGIQPAIFTNAQGQPIITHGNTTDLVTPANPASKGEVLVLYATSLNCVYPLTLLPPDGAAAPASPLAECKNSVGVSVSDGKTLYSDGKTLRWWSLKVLFAGLTPGFVGLYQINVEVPNDTPSGVLDLMFSAIGSGSSNPVKLSVK